MRLLVIGCGQCGGRVADAFAELRGRARLQRGIDIISGCFAVNTDVADLTGLRFIRHDYQHRIVIGGRRTGGHGVGKINQLGAEVAKEDGDKVIEALRTAGQFAEPDAFLLIAGAAGGTGSGAISVLTQQLKERYPEKAVYNLIVLPFKHEEMTEERTIHNTATCLKSAYLVADAVFLADNERFSRKRLSLKNNLSRINSILVQPFYNLLCAGEENKPEYIGSRVLDAGDIIQTLAGWTAIGYGTVSTPLIRFCSKDNSDFRKKAVGEQVELQAMNSAINELSLQCDPRDANRALYLLCASAEKMNINLVKELNTALQRVAPQAVIRSGDYPRGKRSLEITVILSELISVRKVTDYFTKMILYMESRKKRTGLKDEQKGLQEAFNGIPSLLD